MNATITTTQVSKRRFTVRVQSDNRWIYDYQSGLTHKEVEEYVNAAMVSLQANGFQVKRLRLYEMEK